MPRDAQYPGSGEDATNVFRPEANALQALTAYWLAHPLASDTVEGICAWWIVDPLITRAQVDEALHWLVDRGGVVMHRAADGRVRYRLLDGAGTGQPQPS